MNIIFGEIFEKATQGDEMVVLSAFLEQSFILIVGETIEVEAEFMNKFFADFVHVNNLGFFFDEVSKAMEVETIIGDGGVRQATINFKILKKGGDVLFERSHG